MSRKYKFLNPEGLYFVSFGQTGSDATQNYTQTYTYDAVGNILKLKHKAVTGSYTRDYAYFGNSNRLKTTAIGNEVYTYNDYDHRGNMRNMPHLSDMLWNSSNELYRIEKGETAAYYQYSGGQRIRKFVDKGNIKEERIYLGNFEIYRKFGGSSLILERQTVHVSDDTGRIAMLELRNTDYDADGCEDVLTRYVYSNHLQSASLELDQNGEIISYEEYHPYGTTSYQAKSATIAACSKRYRYTGKERDEESGLYYHGARYYIPWLGRWTSVDPLESKYSPQSPYNYGNSNPVTFNDPSGMGGDDTVNVAYGDRTYTVEANYYPSGGGLKETSEFGYRWQEDGQTVVNYHDDKTDKDYSVLEQNAPGSFDGKNLYSWVNIDTGQAEAFTGDTKTYKNHRWLQFHSDAEKDALAKAAAEEKAKVEALHAARTAISWTPFVGGAVDIGEGLYKGNWGQVAGGAASLALDFFGGKLIKAGVVGLKGIIKAGAKESAEIALHETTHAATTSGSRVWEVGAYNEIKGVETGLDAHHVGQKATMGTMVPGYNPQTAPSILVPKIGHTIKGPYGIVSRSTKGITNARQLLARDIKELRRVYGPQGIPNSSLEKLIEMNKTMYPESFLKIKN